MKLTKQIIRTTIKQFAPVTSDIDIATHTCGGNTVNMRYNVNYKVYTIKARGIDQYASSAAKAIDIFYSELYSN